MLGGGGPKRLPRYNTPSVPTSAPRGSSVRIQGTYTCASVGGVKGKPLLLQRKWGTSPWVTLRSVTTGTNGHYKAFVTLKRSTKYRLAFQGVVTSSAHLVRAR